MKKSFISTSITVASFGIVFVLIGFLLTIPATSGNKQSASMESFYWSFYTKPLDLIAQVKQVKIEATTGQVSENTINNVESLTIQTPAETKLLVNSDSTSVKEDDDSTKNTTTDDALIHQVLKMNDCFDVCSDFVEKDWMKDHSFIIL